MKKKKIYYLLVMLMLVSVFSLKTNIIVHATELNDAEDVIAMGSCGPNTVWKLSKGGTLTIGGTNGRIIYVASEWRSANKLVIEEGITEIYHNLFENYTNFTEIVLKNENCEIGIDALPYNVLIRGYAGSTANVYAQKYSHRFICLGYEGNEEGIIDSGKCGEDVYWLYREDGTLIITGDGPMTQSGYKKHKSNVIRLIIDEGITEIDSYAFQDFLKLEGSLIIPQSVTDIGNAAFKNCYGFTGELKIPESVKSIGNEAFENCYGFTGELKIPQDVTSIGTGAFAYCRGFSGDLIIPKGITTISDGVFSQCIGFSGELIMPEGITSIGANAFTNCRGLVGELKIPDEVIKIGASAFADCRGLVGELKIPEEVTKIGSHAFRDCAGFTGNLVIPQSVISIGESAFLGCTGWDKIVIENKNCEIFANSKTFPNNEKLDADGQILKTVILVGHLDSTAYSHANKYKHTFINIEYEWEEDGLEYADACGENAVWYLNENGTLTIKGTGTIENVIRESLYQNKVKRIIIEEGITAIGSQTFDNLPNLDGELKIPQSVTNIGTEAFSGCNGFTGNLVIPEGVTNIGNGAFSGCDGFTGELKIPQSVTDIGNPTKCNGHWKCCI